MEFVTEKQRNTLCNYSQIGKVNKITRAYHGFVNAIFHNSHHEISMIGFPLQLRVNLFIQSHD